MCIRTHKPYVKSVSRRKEKKKKVKGKVRSGKRESDVNNADEEPPNRPTSQPDMPQPPHRSPKPYTTTTSSSYIAAVIPTNTPLPLALPLHLPHPHPPPSPPPTPHPHAPTHDLEIRIRSQQNITIATAPSLLPGPPIGNASETGSIRAQHVLAGRGRRSPIGVDAALADAGEVAVVAGGGAAGTFVDAFVRGAGFEGGAGMEAVGGIVRERWGVAGGVAAGGGGWVEVEGLGDVEGAWDVSREEGAGKGVRRLGSGFGGGEAGVDVFVVGVAGVGAVVVGGGEFDGRLADRVEGLLGVDWWSAGAAGGSGPGGAWRHV